jgi:FkbM family methyltransferase
MKDVDLVSYSYTHEDILLARAFERKTTGFYIDVGANHPSEGSVTKLFSDLGWCGINIEPNPRLAQELRAARPRDVTVNVGLSAQDSVLTLYEVADESGLSTMSGEQAGRYRKDGRTLVEHAVPVTTLAAICEKHVNDEIIDFLSIDVEGYEGQVLNGADFERWHPRVLVIEATLPYTNTLVHQKWEPGILAAGYKFVFFDGINRYYVDAKETELAERLSYPVTPLDQFVTSEQYRSRQELKEYRRLGRLARWAARGVQRLVDLRLRRGTRNG